MLAILLCALLFLTPYGLDIPANPARSITPGTIQEHWSRDDSFSFPVWIALTSIDNATGVIFLFIEPHDFTEGNLRRVFTGFASKPEYPMSLRITVFSDPAMLQRAVNNFQHPVYIDFAYTSKGIEGRRKWQEENDPLPKGYFRAYYLRSAEEENFKYSPDPDKEGYVTIDLGKKRLRQSRINNSNNINEALLSAAAQGDVAKVKAVLAKGADANYKVDGQRTPLASAALYGHLKVVKILIESGADLNAPAGSYGETALMLASGEGFIDVVKTLLQADANPNIKSDDGRTALMEAAENGHIDIVRALLKGGSAVNEKDSEGKTALMVADDNRNLIQALIDAGAELEAGDKAGRTALLYAVVMNQPDKLQVLVENGINVNVKSKDGMTALAMAEQYGFNKIVEILRNARGPK